MLGWGTVGVAQGGAAWATAAASEADAVELADGTAGAGGWATQLMPVTTTRLCP